MTDNGQKQCEGLRESLKRRLEGETDIAIVVSPMRRTLQTAMASLDWLIERGVPTIADAGWQGTSPTQRSRDEGPPGPRS